MLRTTTTKNPSFSFAFHRNTFILCWIRRNRKRDYRRVISQIVSLGSLRFLVRPNWNHQKWTKFVRPLKRCSTRSKHRKISIRVWSVWAMDRWTIPSMVGLLSNQLFTCTLIWIGNKILTLYSAGLRKSGELSTSSPAAKRRRDDTNDISLNISTQSFNSTLNSTGQWEIRILKADLIEANTKVTFREGSRPMRRRHDVR